MPTIVGVVFSRPGKIYYFDPEGLELNIGDRVIVKTANGNDIGEVNLDAREVSDDQINSPLKPVLRRATDEDLQMASRNLERVPEVMDICAAKIEEAELPMKLVNAEFSYDGSRITFFFTAENRVDFRQLVKELGSELKTRIELRQVGVRDAAGHIGGCGPCGQQLCCARFLVEFPPVSVRMAKDQELPLNPSKISGSCGRLLCCLRYEHDAYLDFVSRAPRRGDSVETESGMARVIDLRAPKDAVVVQYESGYSGEVPLSLLNCPKRERARRGDSRGYTRGARSKPPADAEADVGEAGFEPSQAATDEVESNTENIVLTDGSNGNNSTDKKGHSGRRPGRKRKSRKSSGR